MCLYKKLYFIGNGFDLHYNMPCRYNDFKEWLKTNYKSVFDNLTRIYGDINGNWWSNFEENLSKFDPNRFPIEVTKDNFFKQMRKLKKRYGENARDFIDNLELRDGISDLRIRAGEIARFEMNRLKYDLCESFGEWIKGIELPDETRMDYKLDTNAFFITLNYTKTLEYIYKIDESQVIHLHGSIDDGRFVFGHNKTVEEMLNRDLENHMYDRNPDKDKGEFNARFAMFEVAEELRKPVEQILRDNSSVFDSLRYINELEVLGFSYSPIDLPYLKEIIEITGNEITAKLGWHTEEDKYKLKDFAQETGLKNVKLLFF